VALCPTTPPYQARSAVVVDDRTESYIAYYNIFNIIQQIISIIKQYKDMFSLRNNSVLRSVENIIIIIVLIIDNIFVRVEPSGYDRLVEMY